ncbi:PREDICTED: remorin isoform X2 [Fragaria vesca subsp. vesca]|uniref:remorin isoform X2 n=1 Tax=Fragaria vesca subsp. vesca TaxID=101020 RepID=UPI0002C35D14|nr:PREDICTED: remorin isoform X2 [Fragaria vesca subsp. vesca]
MEEETKKEPPMNYVFVDTEKSVIPVSEEKASSAGEPLAIVKENVDHPAAKKGIRSSTEKDVMYAEIETEKRLALIKAWEESEKTKVENRAYKRMSAVGLWEENKKSSVEAKLRKIEEKFERKKAEYVEKMKNKVAEIHKASEEKRALIEATQREESLKVAEAASKFRESRSTPKRLFVCFTCANSVL